MHVSQSLPGNPRRDVTNSSSLFFTVAAVLLMLEINKTHPSFRSLSKPQTIPRHRQQNTFCRNFSAPRHTDGLVIIKLQIDGATERRPTASAASRRSIQIAFYMLGRSLFY